jgi:hypothetical protein
VFLVVLLTRINPTLFNRQIAMPGENAWFDLAVWGGIVTVSGYAMGTLHERNQQGLAELQESYDGTMFILPNEKYSTAHAYRVSLYATRIGEALGLDSGRVEDMRTAVLLQNVNALGISNDVLYKAANTTQDELEKSMKKEAGKTGTPARLAGSLQRSIPNYDDGTEADRFGRKHGGRASGSAGPGAGRRV